MVLVGYMFCHSHPVGGRQTDYFIDPFRTRVPITLIAIDRYSLDGENV